MQKNHSILCSGLWPFIVLPLLLTGIVLIFSWQEIERNVALTAQEMLNDDHPWSTVENYNRGRDVLISGSAPSQLAAEEALNIAQTSVAVRAAKFIGEIKPILEPAKVSIQFASKEVIISGAVNSLRAKKSLLNNAKSQFRKRAVIDQLLVSNTVASAPGISDLLAAASFLSDGSELIFEGDRLTVLGKVKSVDQKNSLASRFAQIFSGEVQNSLVIDVDVGQQCLEKILTLLDGRQIQFDSGTSNIHAQSAAVVDGVFKVINSCPNTGFQIIGHTDSYGANSANLALSRERAESVVKELVSRGLQIDQFTARGYGSDKPIQSNDTAEGRAANRRIEFKLNN